MIYFALMLVSFTTTLHLISKNNHRAKKIGDATGFYSIEFYKKLDATVENEKVSDGIS